jgi:hypothetical protein
MATYFGFAFSASMLPRGIVNVQKADLLIGQVKARLAGGYVSACNRSHQATIEVAKARFGLEINIPDNPPRVFLIPGDCLVLMQVTGLPRLTDRREYSTEEIAGAKFQFMELTVT